jgi:hypothetical protein
LDKGINLTISGNPDGQVPVKSREPARTYF